ncbi:MAG: TonB-dependent receptor [Nitrospirota bacterium]
MARHRQILFPARLAFVAIALLMVCPVAAQTEENKNKLSAPPARGIPDELQLLKEEETVSIASRYEQPISQAPSNVYVITDEDIRHSGAVDLPTVLRRIPGMEIIQMSGADFNVSVRGNNQLQTNKILVMIDGRSIYNDAQGFVHWKMLPITLPEIKRIEVLKGPASATYGFNAFDGVVNIITKSPEEMRGTTIQFGGGELGTISSAGIHAGTYGKLGYRFSIGHDQNQQWRNRSSLAFRADKFSANTTYALTENSKITLNGGLIDSNRFDGTFFESSLSQAKPLQAHAGLAYERPDFVLRGYWMQTGNDAIIQSHPLLNDLFTITDRSGNPQARFTLNTFNLEMQHTFTLGQSFRTIYGTHYRHNQLSSNFLDSLSKEDRLGFFVQQEWTPIRPVTFVAGVRYDLNTFIHATVSPRLAVLLRPADDHTIRISFSVGYRPPTLLETHAQQLSQIVFDPPGTPPTKIQGNPNMIPEQLISYEVGYQGWFLKHRLRTRVDAFYNLVRDLQDPFFTSNTRTLTFANRAGKASLYGVEAGFELLLTSWLQAFANLSYVKVDDKFGGNVERVAPRYKANAGLRADFENGLNGEVLVHYVDKTNYPFDPDFRLAPLFGNATPSRRLDSYTLLNLRCAYKFWHQKAEGGYLRDAEIAVSAFNSLNDTHKEHPLGDMIGSRVMGWLTVRY